MNYKKRLSSLRYRIALTVFVLESILMVLVLWQTLSFSQLQVEGQIDASEAAIMELLGSLSRVALFRVEFDELQGYIQKAQRDPKILSIMLLNENRMVVASTRLEDIGALSPVFEERQDEHWRIQEIGDLGTLAVNFSRQALSQATKAARNRGVAIALGGMLVILAIGIVIGYWLTRRLSLLTHAAEQFERGGHDIHTDFSGSDEVSELGRTFEHMRETIERNIHELEARSLELTRYSEELESFSYSLVHDLRTPVRAITSFSQILQEDAKNALTADHCDYLERIARAGHTMARLIDDLSELGRLARQTMHYQAVDLGELAARINEDLRQRHPARSVSIEIQPGMRVDGDRELLREALVQLIDNAWKFTQERDQAEIRIGRVEKDAGTVYFVRDNGIGLPMAYAEKIFEPFQRLHLDEIYAGTGIGLVIASRVIARHGGRLWVESSDEGGATFYFSLRAG